MGSPLGPVLANLFMGHYENIWLNSIEANNVCFYKRYVDDVFCLFSSEKEVDSFFKFINKQHPNIKFTVEKEIDKKLAFLDVLIEHNNLDSFSSTTFYKSTYTGLLTNYYSFTPSCYKLGLVKTLIDRAFKINDTWKGFHLDCQKIKSNLQRNCFPLNLVDWEIKSFLNKNFNLNNEHKSERKDHRYYKLPFIGKFSSLTQKRLNKVIHNYCKVGTSIKLIFTSYKIRSFFSNKDRIPNSMKSQLVYKFICAGCNASYIGETNRNFYKRINEHL